MAPNQPPAVHSHAFLSCRSGERWRASRAAWQPFFSRQSLQGHAAFMARSAEALCGLLGSAAGSGQQLDIWKSLQSLTLDVVGNVAFGTDFNTLAAPESDGQQAAQTAAAEPGAAADKAGGRSRSLRSASTDALLRAVRTVFEVCGPAQPLFGLCFIFPEVRRCSCCWMADGRSVLRRAAAHCLPHEACWPTPLLRHACHAAILPHAGGTANPLASQPLAQRHLPAGELLQARWQAACSRCMPLKWAAALPWHGLLGL